LPSLAAVALPIYILLLPFLMLLLFVPGFPADDAWLLRVSFTVLAPFSATLWYILAHRLITHKQSGYSSQFTVFVGTALIVVAMLALRIYRLP
jgi:hypothetical protein